MSHDNDAAISEEYSMSNEEWTEIDAVPALQAAVARGDEIERWSISTASWSPWDGSTLYFRYRSRPKGQTKTIVMREYFWYDAKSETGGYSWHPSICGVAPSCLVRWTGNEHNEEVPL